VIALGRGGALETVPPLGGVFYDAPTEESLAGAIELFEKLEPEIRPDELQAHAQRFDESEFQRRMAAVLAAPVTSCDTQMSRLSPRR
jgi:hypothetical protein